MPLNNNQMLPARVRDMRQMKDVLNAEDIILAEIEKIIDEMYQRTSLLHEETINEEWLESKLSERTGAGVDVTGYAEQLLTEIVLNVSELQHIDMPDVRKFLNKWVPAHLMYKIRLLLEYGLIYSETVRFMRLDVQAYFYFFKRILNGDWLLDGSVSLGQIPIAEIAVVIALGTIRVVHKGRPCLHMIDISQVFHAALPCSICSVEIVFRFDSSKSIPKADMDRICVNIPLLCTGMVEADSVTVKKDLWHLDGQILMNGSRILDAEVRKEIL